MAESDTDYFQLRAEQEVERARLATKPEVVAVHYALSELYFECLAKARPEGGIAQTAEEPSGSLRPSHRKRRS